MSESDAVLVSDVNERVHVRIDGVMEQLRLMVGQQERVTVHSLTCPHAGHRRVRWSDGMYIAGGRIRGCRGYGTRGGMNEGV